MITIEAAVTEYLQAREADSAKPMTIKWYANKLKPFVERFGMERIDNFKATNMRSYIVDLKNSDMRYVGRPQARRGQLSNETLRGHDTALRMFWGWAELEYGFPKAANPMHKIKPPKKQQREPKSANVEDVMKLIQCVAQSDKASAVRDLALMMFMADTGTRAGGTLSLTDDRLDLAHCRAIVHEKGDKLTKVYLKEPTVAAIKRWLAVRPAKAKTVFCSLASNASGNKLTNSGLILIMKRWSKLAKVSGRVNPHAWRHMYARLFIMNGGSLTILSKLMGHSTIQITVEYYAVFTDDEQQDAHTKFSPLNNLKGVIDIGGARE